MKLLRAPLTKAKESARGTWSFPLGQAAHAPQDCSSFLCRHSSCVLANQARGWIHLTTNPYKRKESFSQPGKLPKQFTMYPRKCQW